jgi:hypothetical protein
LSLADAGRAGPVAAAFAVCQKIIGRPRAREAELRPAVEEEIDDRAAPLTTEHGDALETSSAPASTSAAG